MAESVKQTQPKISSADLSNQARVDHLKRMNKIQRNYQNYLESIVLDKFVSHILRTRILISKIPRLFETSSASKIERFSDTIPKRPSVKERAEFIRSQPKTEWAKLNPTLKCYSLQHRPILLRNVPGIPSNGRIKSFIKQIFDVWQVINYDLDRLQSAVRIQIARLPEAEHLGMELFEEYLQRIGFLQENIQPSFDFLQSYHDKRVDAIISVIRYGHFEDSRVFLDRFDQRYQFFIRKVIKDLHQTSVLVYDFLVKNAPQLATNLRAIEDLKSSYGLM